MGRREHDLQRWVEQQLLTPAQAEQILTFEATRPSGNWIVISFLLLGGLIIGLGAISLVAANWQQIPDWVKLGSDFTLLLVLVMALQHPAIADQLGRYELLLLLYLLLCLASIGLIGQIYHTSGTLYHALLFWSLITAPAALTARYLATPLLWAIAFSYALAVTMAEQPDYRHNDLAIIMLLPLLLLQLAQLASWLRKPTAAPARALRIWGVICGTIALMLLEADQYLGFDEDRAGYTPNYLLALLLAVGIIATDHYRRLQKGLLLAVLLLYLIVFELPLHTDDSPLLYASCNILILTLLALFFASEQRQRLFQWLLLLIAIRFFLLYLQAIGSLALTGIGLVLSGLLIIGVVLLWQRHRHRLSQWATRIAA